ncbi:unnamed protein product [Cylindrotheca closterium]|uniref:Uncharacterized protein n=1 Tax=Cylindrotheca closterium TaxID=2856 RepID=A0AAD2FYU3_9STRA|nr:unnamed protein product [Cylindrotheca closterium]
MSDRLARYITVSSSEESSVEDRYDATSFGSQFDSDSSDSENETYKGMFSYDSEQESQISLTPGEEYVLDTLFGWMDRPLCAAPTAGQSLLLQSARASALQNITANRPLYIKAHAENPEIDSDSDSDTDSFITQEVEEYSEGPEESYSEAQVADLARSNFSEVDDYDMEESEGPQLELEMEYEEERKKGDESKQPKSPKSPKHSKPQRKVKPSVASPRGTKQKAVEASDINLFHSESQDESDSDEVVNHPAGSEDEISAAHRVSFLKTVMKKKERKAKSEVMPSNVFEPPSKKMSKAARKPVPVEVKILGGKAAGVPADVKVVASSKKAQSKVPQKSSETPEKNSSEVPAEIPLEVSVAVVTETATSVPIEIQTKAEKPKKTRGRSPSKPPPINVDEINDEMVDMEVEKSPSLEFLAAKIVQQSNTPRNRSNRDPTPTRRDARSISMEEKDVKPDTDQQVQDKQVQEIVEIDLVASREPPMVYAPRSPHEKKTKESEPIREPRRNSRPDPTDVSEPIVHPEPVAVLEEAIFVAAKAEPKATRAKRLSSKKKSKKKKFSNVHPGQPQQQEEVGAFSQVGEIGPVGSITVEELKETLSELSHPQIQQNQPRVKEEPRHVRGRSVDLSNTEQNYVQARSPQPVEGHQLPLRHMRTSSRGNMDPLAQSIDDALALRKSQERLAPVPHSSPRQPHESSPRATQNIIQYGSPLPTNNQDNPIDIEEYMAQREMLNREAPRAGLSDTAAPIVRTTDSPPIAVREEMESPRQPVSPRTPRRRVRPEVALGQHGGAADLPVIPNGKNNGKNPKHRNYYFGEQGSRQTSTRHKAGIRQPKQYDALNRNDPAGHIIDHQYDTKKKSKKSSSGKSKSNLASIDDLKQLEKRIEEHFRNSRGDGGENDIRSTVSTKELRKLERQLVLQLRRVEEKRAAKLERLRSKKKSSRRQKGIVEAEVIAVEPKDETIRLSQKSHSKNSGDANRFKQLQALRMSKEMGRYMSKQPGNPAATVSRHFQGQAY